MLTILFHFSSEGIKKGVFSVLKVAEMSDMDDDMYEEDDYDLVSEMCRQLAITGVAVIAG